MIRTQIQLTEEQYRSLRELALQEDKSVAELIRYGVDWLLMSAGMASQAERRQRALAAIGRFHTGDNDLAEEHDRYFAGAIEQ